MCIRQSRAASVEKRETSSRGRGPTGITVTHPVVLSANSVQTKK